MKSSDELHEPPSDRGEPTTGQEATTVVPPAADVPTPDFGPPPEASTVSAQGVPLVASPDGFVLLGELGRGGMGVVYRARDLALDREVAVKVLGANVSLESSSAVRFADEVRITGQLQHPGIPPVYRVGKLPDGRPFMAMKLIKGRTLADLIAAQALGADRLRVFEAICQAVGYAHARSVIHRDLKPQNVMVGNFGEVQVMDWGLAKVLGRTPDPRSQGPDTPPRVVAPTAIRSLRDSDTEHGSVLGTPSFMAPEQAIGGDRYDQRTDVFGLGGILCMMLTGAPPYTGAHFEVLRHLAARAKLEDCFFRLDASGAEPELVALCKKCLSAEPDDRPADGTAVAAAVTELRAAVDERARRAEMDREKAAVRAGEQRKRQRVVLWAAGLVVAALAAAAAVSLRQAADARMAAKNEEAQKLIADEKATAATKAEAATAAQLEKTRIAEAAAHAETKKTLAALGIANERTKSLSDAYGDFVFGIQNRLEDRPGTLELRKELLETARAGLKKVLDDARKHGNADHAIVWSHLRLGDVELKLGSPAVAQQEYRSGHDLARTRAAADPTDAQAQRDLSISYDKLGDVALALSKPKDALDSYRKGLAIAQTLAAADPKDAQTQRDLGVSLSKLGDAALRLEQPKDALDFYQKCHEVCETLAAADPRDAQAQRDLSISYDRLGDVALLLEQPKDALASYRRCNEVCEKLAAADPKDALAQRDLSVSLSKLGDVTLRLGQPKEALDLYRKGLAVAQARAAADPKDAQAQRDLLVGYFKLGAVSEGAKDPAEAIQWYQKALAVAERFDKPEYFAAEVKLLTQQIADCRAELAKVKPREVAPPPRGAK